MIERTEALNLLAQQGLSAGLLQHSLASEAVLRALARHFGEDEDVWGLTGLLHDVDYPATAERPERHGLDGADLLAGRLPGPNATASTALTCSLAGSLRPAWPPFAPIMAR